MNPTTEHPKLGLGSSSRRGFLASAGALMAGMVHFLRRPLRSFAGGRGGQPPQAAELTPGAMDLQGIFKDEIHANYKDNVYAALGNKLQLDGEAYVQVSRALTSFDMAEIIRTSPMPEEARQRLLRDQIAQTEKAFLDAVRGLYWPQYIFNLVTHELHGSGISFLHLCAQMTQPVIFTFFNPGASPQTVRVESNEITLPVSEMKVEPDSTRYLCGSIFPEKKGEWAIAVRVATEKGSGHLTMPVSVRETVVLEGELAADEHDPEPPMARIRMTDANGTYFPPLSQPSGLIRMIPHEHGPQAERWAYADGKFQVRVPVGKIRVSLRRGLEYRGLDEEIEIAAGDAPTKRFVLSRWAYMEKEGWYPGDMHVHMLDPATALFESRAEGLHCVNVMVFKQLEDTYSREHFTGGVDPASDHQHFIYYNEEFRNEPMGHVGLINLKKLVEPISTGRLGYHWPTLMRYQNLNMPLPLHGDAQSPDFPLLLQAMREAHKEGGWVDWAHLRSKQWEFPLDAEEHQIDLVDIMTHTEIPQDLQLWYALLNCDFRIPACAGTDRIAPTDPIGHQRVYVWLDEPLSYANWMKALKAGASFVTNGPMVQLQVNGLRPGGAIPLSAPTELSISAHAVSQLPFERLEVIANGEIIHTVSATGNGTAVEVAFQHKLGGSAWIAARCMGRRNPELFYTHPVFAHTNPVHIRYQEERIAKPESAKLLLGYLDKLEDWAEHQAYFANARQRSETLKTIRTGMSYFQKIARGAKQA